VSAVIEGEADLWESFADGLRPPPELTVTEWAEEKRILPNTSAEPGRWKTDRTPYLREIMDAVSPQSPVREVTLMKPAQTGGTEVLLNAIGHMMECDPGASLVVMSTESTSREWAHERLRPLLESTPSLAAMFSTNQRDPDNRKTFKKFPGGFLAVTYSTSGAELRSRPVRYLYLDEVDAYPKSLGKEGDPVGLARARTRTFAHNRLILKVSTPTVEGDSRIQSEYEQGDRCVFQVPCPHCHFYQVLHPRRMIWREGKPTDAHFECEACAERIDHEDKAYFLPRGKWVPTRPDADGTHRSFHLLGTYSPLGWMAWSEMAAAWDKAEAEKDDDAKIVVVNTMWGCPAEISTTEELDHEKLWMRRTSWEGDHKVLGDYGLLTAGVDVQADRLECEVVAWREGMRSQSVAYHKLYGDPTQPGVWDELWELLERDWKHESGGLVKLSRMAVDSGYLSDEVYKFGQRDRRRIIITKGSSTTQATISPPRDVEIGPRGNKRKIGVKLWTLNVDNIKHRLMRWLELPYPEFDEETGEIEEFPAGWCEFPQYTRAWFEGLCSERRVLKSRGWRWEKIYDRNEPLDCRVYAMAAAMLEGIERWDEERWHEARRGIAQNQKGRQQKGSGRLVSRSKYLGR